MRSLSVVIPNYNHARFLPEDIPRFEQLHRAGRIKLAPLVSDCVPLDRINEAIAGIRSGEVSGRCLIEMAPS
jgi:Zn-dependent alcohol dehydrogenase